MSSIAELYNRTTNGGIPASALKNYKFPNGGGDYSASSQIQRDYNNITQGGIPPTALPNYKFPGGSGEGTFAGGGDSTYKSKFIDPATGNYYDPKTYADNYMKNASGKGNATIPQAAGDLITIATGLNNERNDIATGTTDPYKIGNKSGVDYTPAELAAIEKAYAGVYEPALTDVFIKIDAKEKEAAAATELKNRLEEMKIQHGYNMEEKALTSGNGVGGYSPEDPIVAGWVERLNRTGESIQTAIPGVKNQKLRDAVMLGLNANKYKSAVSAGNLDTVNTLNDMLANESLENISGPVGQLTGGIFGKAATAKTQYNQILGALQLAKAGSIKGQGQISDYERKVLKEASAAVDRGMNDEEFRKALIKLRGVMMTSAGMEAPVKITDPSTGQSDIQNLNTLEINEFLRDGARIEYLELNQQ